MNDYSPLIVKTLIQTNIIHGIVFKNYFKYPKPDQFENDSPDFINGFFESL